MIFLSRRVKRHGKSFYGIILDDGVHYLSESKIPKPISIPRPGLEDREAESTYHQLQMEYALQEHKEKVFNSWRLIAAYISKNITKDFEPAPDFIPKKYLNPLIDAFANALILAYLTGRYQIRSKITQLLAQEEGKKIHFQDWVPDLAVQSLLDKQVVPPQVFRILSDELKRRAFTVSQITSMQALTLIKEKLAEHLRQGKTLMDFRDQVFDILQGETTLPFFRLETVWRTNIQTAYHAGRWHEIQTLRDYIWGLEYHAILDDRVRPSHARMHGFIAPLDDPVWRVWYPPNGYNCRCTVSPITYAEARLRNLQYTRIRPNFSPDPGFNSFPDIFTLPQSVYEQAERFRISLPSPKPPLPPHELIQNHPFNRSRRIFDLLVGMENSNPLAYRYLLSPEYTENLLDIMFKPMARNVGGRYIDRKIILNKFVSTQDLIHSQTFAHELAHHLWFNFLSDEAKQKVQELYFYHTTKIIDRLPSSSRERLLSVFTQYGELGRLAELLERYVPEGWPRTYAYTNPSEFFSVCVESLPQLADSYPALYNKIVRILRGEI